MVQVGSGASSAEMILDHLRERVRMGLQLYSWPLLVPGGNSALLAVCPGRAKAGQEDVQVRGAGGTVR